MRGTGGGVAIYGDFYTEYLRTGAWLGYPITDPISVSGGQAIYFQKGRCWYKGTPFTQKIAGFFEMKPYLARTEIIKVTHTGDLPRLSISFTLPILEYNRIAFNPNVLANLWRDRLILQQVGKQNEQIPLIPIHRFNEITPVRIGHGFSYRILKEGRIETETVSTVPDEWSVEGPQGSLEEPPHTPPPPPPDPSAKTTKLSFNLPAGATLKDRTLYDLAMRLPNGKTYVLAPHAFYVKESWDNFGFLHVTDLHLSQELDSFRQRLIEAGHSDGASQFVNCNDRFRDTIKYANQWYKAGKLDFIVATGDLVECVYEGDNREFDNRTLLRNLILGQAPGRETPNEELQIPIFMTAGNHDYRPNPHKLFFYLSMPGPKFITGKDPLLRLYRPLNLDEDEARALQNGECPTLHRDEGYAMASVDLSVGGEVGGYIVSLGTYHRIVMLNSGYDLGVIDSDGDVWHALWGANEDTSDFIGDSPRSRGGYYEPLVQTALEEAGDNGLVIIGIHAPLFNLKGNELDYYFRETAHPTLIGETAGPTPINKLSRREVESFLIRHTGALHTLLMVVPETTIYKDTWPRTGTPYFKKGDIGELLDFGICGGEYVHGVYTTKDLTKKLLKLCVGKSESGQSRPVDLVLFGHEHRNMEFRAKWDTGNNDIFFYTDFYTENPTEYYPSYDHYYIISPGPYTIPKLIGDQRPIHIRVKDGAPLNTLPTEETDPNTGTKYRCLDVPPYTKPLSKAISARNWWKEHRPLFLQTSSLGPIDSNQRINREKPEKPPKAFQGFRYISVNSNVIKKIHYITIAKRRVEEWGNIDGSRVIIR